MLFKSSSLLKIPAGQQKVLGMREQCVKVRTHSPCSPSSCTSEGQGHSPVGFLWLLLPLTCCSLLAEKDISAGTELQSPCKCESLVEFIKCVLFWHNSESSRTGSLIVPYVDFLSQLMVLSHPAYGAPGIWSWNV